MRMKIGDQTIYSNPSNWIMLIRLLLYNDVRALCRLENETRNRNFSRFFIKCYV